MEKLLLGHDASIGIVFKRCKMNYYILTDDKKRNENVIFSNH